MTYQITATKMTGAPPEEVWKLLYDASRFGSWWEGVRRTEPDAHGRLVFHRADGAALPSILTRDRGAGRIIVSCLALDVRYEWLLAPLENGGTRITSHCTLPEHEAARHEIYRAAIAQSLRRLAHLAFESSTDAPRARG